MCFGYPRKASSTSSPPAQITSPNHQVDSEKTNITADKSIATKSDTPGKTPKKDEYGESMGLTMHARHQKAILEAYPDGNVPEQLRGFGESGMCSGPIGGPMGGGPGMAMNSGI